MLLITPLQSYDNYLIRFPVAEMVPKDFKNSTVRSIGTETGTNTIPHHMLKKLKSLGKS